MRIDSDGSTEPHRPFATIERSTPRNWRPLLAVGLLVTIATVSFVLGRNTTDSGIGEGSGRAMVRDVLGSADVQASVTFADQTEAVIACRPVVTSDERRAALQVVHFGSDGRGQQIYSYHQLATPATCESCAIEPIELASERMLLGHCDSSINIEPVSGSGPRFGTRSAFVVASPPAPGESPIGLNIQCGLTTLRVDDDQIALDAAQPTHPASPFPPRALPPNRFTREPGSFVADDVRLLQYFCETGAQSQLVTPDTFTLNRASRSDLAYLEIESELGKIGFRGGVLIAVTLRQCNILRDAQPETGSDPAASDTTIAAITGLDPPEGYDDWFVVCQVR